MRPGCRSSEHASKTMLRALSSMALALGSAAAGANTFDVFGETFFRYEGKPFDEQRVLTVPNPGYAYTLTLINGGKPEDGHPPVASAEIRVDGNVVVAPAEFKTQGSLTITKALQLGNGNPSLALVELRAEPGSAVWVSVTGESTPPAFTSAPVTSTLEDQSYSYTLAATDPDAGEQLTYELTAGPAGLTFDASSNSLQWAPTNDDVGDHTVAVRVTDLAGFSSEQRYTLAVVNVNDPPLITTVPAVTEVDAGSPFSYTIGVDDPDVGDSFTYVVANGPSGMTVTDNVVSWTPGATQVGNHSVTLRVSDSGGATAEQSFMLTVTSSNTPPTITSTPPTQWRIHRLLSYQMAVTDPDADESFTFALTEGPTDMTLSATGALTWTPRVAGSFPVTLTVTDSYGARAIQQFTLTVAQGLTVTITEPATLITVGSTPLQVRGAISDDNATLTVNGVPVSPTNGGFSAAVSLVEGHNTILARAVSRDGEEVTDSISVSMDLTPPYITIESPVDGATVSSPTIAVSGLINDIVRGTVSEGQANVVVNGVAAAVANRSYLAENVALVEGANTITVAASDQVGNTSSVSVTVNYQVPAPKRIELVDGQDQAARIRDSLPAPLVVKLLDSDGVTPVANKPVVFRVVQGDGAVATDDNALGQAVVANSDAQGVARASFTLGSRSGIGNHRVRARAVGFDGEVMFYASAVPKLGDKVSVNSGNNQRGAAYQPLPQPFVVAVTDEGANVIEGAEVEFKVTRGTGFFQNGQASYVAATDSDGRATAHLTLGGEVGLDQQRVTATLLGTEIRAGFTASALQSGDPGQTTISGLVLDNQDVPIPGVTIRIDGANREAVTNDQGQFTLTEAPVGPVHLIADGSTAVLPGEWPTLSYNIVTVAGAENPLASPIYMVKLDTDRAVWVGDQDVAFTVPDMPGFKLTVLKDSVTFPNGAKNGFISVTKVNANKVPMVPPNGMQPQFIVTIQPAGARFDPPAPLSLPNVDGHAPGAQVEMYSYDHDLEEFVTIGVGTVSADGSTINSNPGVGVVKAGWHCGSQPAGSGCCSGGGGGGGCAICQTSKSNDCNNNDCEPDDTQDPGECKKCSGGAPVNDDSEDPGECKSCKNGNPENDPDGTTCDDGKFCTSADGKEPGPDQCTDGKCEGKEIKRQKTSETIVEADLAKYKQYLLEPAEKFFKNLGKFDAGIKPYYTLKVQGKKLYVRECCEQPTPRMVENTGDEGSLVLEAGLDAKMVIPTPIAGGLVQVLVAGKATVRGNGFVQTFEAVCPDPDKCYEEFGGQVSGFGEFGLGLAVIHPNVLSVTGTARYGVSRKFSAKCGDFQLAPWCWGPLSLRGQAKALSFASYTVVYVVPGTQGCVTSQT